MSGQASPVLAAWGFAGAALLFLLDLALTTMLLSVASLSRVALRRLSAESEDSLPYLEGIKTLASTYRVAIQTARQLSLLGGTVVVALAAGAAGWPHPWWIGVGTGAVLGVGVLETMLARFLAFRDPRAAIRSTAFLVRALHLVSYPILRPLQRVLRPVERLVPLTDEEKDEESEQEVEAFIEVGEREGILAKDEGEMVRGIMDLGETLVREIMVPRTDIVAFPSTTAIEDARRGFLRNTHSRVPVYRDTIDNVVGILHVRDLLRPWEQGNEKDPISAHLRPAFFVPETRLVAELLREMRTGAHIALVVDEYGGIAGLVTLEDLLEEIVGDIRDEHSAEEARIEQEADGAWLVSGIAHVEEIEDLFEVDMGERDFDTVGGLVVATLGRVPEVGESLEIGGLRVEIVRADRRRVYRVRIRPLTAADRSSASAS
jgi:CBS domain containing-hemolysin-like protein